METEDQVCNNLRCKFCKQRFDAIFICGAAWAPTMAQWSEDMRADIIQCLTFKPGIGGKPYIKHQEEDGLFMGQIREE